MRCCTMRRGSSEDCSEDHSAGSSDVTTLNGALALLLYETKSFSLPAGVCKLAYFSPVTFWILKNSGASWSNVFVSIGSV